MRLECSEREKAIYIITYKSKKSMMICIEPHYMGSLEYFVSLLQVKSIHLEVNDYFVKQTFRNRCYILGSNDVQVLVVPVHHSNKAIYRDVKIDYGQNWLKDHRRAIQSAYGKAPFYDHFYDLFYRVWMSKPVFLMDLSIAMMTICLKILQIDMQIDQTYSYSKPLLGEYVDQRNSILPKISFMNRNIYKPKPYIQNFGNNFVSNLSIIDLLMCEGPNGKAILQRSKSLSVN